MERTNQINLIVCHFHNCSRPYRQQQQHPPHVERHLASGPNRRIALRREGREKEGEGGEGGEGEGVGQCPSKRSRRLLVAHVFRL